MKALIVAGEFPPLQGGLGDFTRCLADALSGEGVDVAVLAPREARLPADARYRLLPMATGWGWRDLRRVAVVSGEFDLVNLQYQAAAYRMRLPVHLLPLALRGEATRLVTTFHDLRVPYLFPKAGRLRRAVVRTLLDRSAAAIVTNEEDALAARQMAPQARPALVRIGSNIAPLPYSPSERQLARERWGLPKDALVIGYFGFLNATKGALDLVEAASRLQASGLDPWLLFIGGLTGASDVTNRRYADAVHQAATQRGLGQRVAYTGFVSDADVSRAFYACDICALPYRDGASYRRGSLMAALAHGCAIVTTEPALPVAGLSEGDNVVLVPPAQPEALAAALTGLARDPARRAEFGERARSLARRFEWGAIARETLAVYRAAAAGQA